MRKLVVLILLTTLLLPLSGCGAGRYVADKSKCIAGQTCPQRLSTNAKAGTTVYFIECQDKGTGVTSYTIVSKSRYDDTHVGDSC